jgi:hypothetical protein
MIATLAAAFWLAQEIRPAGSLESLPDPPAFRMKALTAKDLEETKARAAGRALAGTHRGLPPDILKKGKWQKRKDGGFVWRLRLQSAGAAGMRVHFQDFDAGASNVWLYEAGGKQPEGPYTGKRDAFWSAVVYGETALIEYAPSDRKKAKKLPFVIDQISHQL